MKKFNTKSPQRQQMRNEKQNSMQRFKKICFSKKLHEKKIFLLFKKIKQTKKKKEHGKRERIDVGPMGSSMYRIGVMKLSILIIVQIAV